MDAFAVAISYGCSPQKPAFRHMLLISFSFGSFQAVMPVLGWHMGKFFEKLISNYDHWVAFALLVYIGIRMIIEGLKNHSADSSCTAEQHVMDLKKLFILSVATSIDAFAVGLSLSLIGYEIFIPALIIGITTFIFSYTGVTMGCRLHSVFGKKAEIFGGIILIVIGLKIVVEHGL